MFYLFSSFTPQTYARIYSTIYLLLLSQKFLSSFHIINILANNHAVFTELNLCPSKLYT